jgi:hypothetical protein
MYSIKKKLAYFVFRFSIISLLELFIVVANLDKEGALALKRGKYEL